jgi:hypothetical protein
VKAVSLQKVTPLKLALPGNFAAPMKKPGETRGFAGLIYAPASGANERGA